MILSLAAAVKSVMKQTTAGVTRRVRRGTKPGADAAVHPDVKRKSKRCVSCGETVVTYTPPTGAGDAAWKSKVNGEQDFWHSGGKIYCSDCDVNTETWCVHGVRMDDECQHCPNDERLKTEGDVRRHPENQVHLGNREEQQQFTINTKSVQSVMILSIFTPAESVIDRVITGMKRRISREKSEEEQEEIAPNLQRKSKHCVACGEKLLLSTPPTGAGNVLGKSDKIRGVTYSGGKISCIDCNVSHSDWCAHGVKLTDECPHCPADQRLASEGDVRRYHQNKDTNE